MRNLIRFFILSLISFSLMGVPAYAQTYPQNSSSPLEKGIKRDFAAVVFGGIGGGVLGLSTLSFYGEPQEHTNNITVGALLGMIAGATYVFYNRYEPRGRQDTYDNYGQIEQLIQKQKQESSVKTTPVQFELAFQF